MDEIASVRATARRPAVKESPHASTTSSTSLHPGSWARSTGIRAAASTAAPRYSEELRVSRRLILDGVRAIETRERQPE
jgi:hypothetical protein